MEGGISPPTFGLGLAGGLGGSGWVWVWVWLRSGCTRRELRFSFKRIPAFFKIIGIKNDRVFFICLHFASGTIVHELQS